MRDIDQFVSSCSIANDPDFDPSAVQAVWTDYWHRNLWKAVAEQGKTRRDVMKRVLPRTTLRSSARVEDFELVVQGPLGRFHIHLGTSHARRENNDEILRVPVDRKAKEQVKKVFLPFEGDGAMVDILAKAFALASAESLDASAS
jgi:hypothetical protein